MKTNALSLLAATSAALLLTAACAGEDTAGKQEQKQENKTDGLTTFVVADTRSTRTTAEYNGSGLNFYWTEGDRLWVNNGGLIQDAENNISTQLVPNPTTPAGVKRAATARFSFEGSYTAPSYPVRYTGKNNPDGDKVTIKAQQNQTVPNDASHIGEDGDCGTATAHKTYTAEGIDYCFTLDHKASYLTLLPYSTNNFSTSVKLTQVKLTANEALSGQFNFTDNGIDLTSRPAPTAANRSITLTLNGGGTNGFPLPYWSEKKTNAVMVLPPGTYNNVSIEYTLYDQFTTKTATIKKNYAKLTFTPGKNKKVTTNLLLPLYEIRVGTWYSGCGPNTNEALWYMYRGDPHMDVSTVYAARQGYHPNPVNICVGGIWILKKDYIDGFRDDVDHTGFNQVYPGSPGNPPCSGISEKKTIPFGNPQDSRYYFLPSVYSDGSTALKSGDGSIRYWVGTAYGNGQGKGQVFASDILPHDIGIGNNYDNVVLAYWEGQ